MKVFVSWSGKKSRDVANVFRDWLPMVLHSVEPFVSAKDIRAGTRWQAEIASELDDTEFGLICVTSENQAAEWLNFEAGALAKSVDTSRVIPLAIDLAPADIANPLGQFQAVRLDRDDIEDLVVSINEVSEAAIPEENVRRALKKWWPDLESELEKIEARDYHTPKPAPTRSDRDLMEEILDTVRSSARVAAAPRRAGEPQTNRFFNDLTTLFVDAEIGGWSGQVEGSKVTVVLEPRGAHDLSPRLVRDTKRLAEHYGLELRIRLADPSREGDAGPESSAE